LFRVFELNPKSYLPPGLELFADLIPTLSKFSAQSRSFNKENVVSTKIIRGRKAGKQAKNTRLFLNQQNCLALHPMNLFQIYIIERELLIASASRRMINRNLV